MAPTLTKIADRSYTVESNLTEAVAFFNVIFQYAGAGKPTDLYLHRWYHFGAEGKTVIVLFKPHPPGSRPRLSLLGPRLDDVDTLVVEAAR